MSPEGEPTPERRTLASEAGSASGTGVTSAFEQALSTPERNDALPQSARGHIDGEDDRPRPDNRHGRAGVHADVLAADL